ncbi:DUF2304 family protein [bacterium]|nr:DUF2304 family protein [bacterium]
MVKLIFPIVMSVIVLALFRSRRLSLDLSGVLIAALVAILVVTNNDSILIFLSYLLSIESAPLAIVGVAIGLLLGIVIVLAVMISDMRRRQKALLRKIAKLELSLKQPKG